MGKPFPREHSHKDRLMGRSLPRVHLRRLWKPFTRYFITGLVLFVPFYLTLRLLWWGFQNIDSVFQPLVDLFAGREMTGIGFVLTVMLIFVFGMLGIGVFGIEVFGRRVLRMCQAVFERMPVVCHIYGPLKQTVESFFSKEEGGFTETVIVEFPRKGMYTLGLVTRESTDAAGKVWVNVYIPPPPTPTDGIFVVFEECEVIRTDIPVIEAIKIMISSGKVTHRAIFDLLGERTNPAARIEQPVRGS